VAFAFERGKNVFSAKQPTEGQASIAGEAIASGLEVFAGHRKLAFLGLSLSHRMLLFRDASGESWFVFFAPLRLAGCNGVFCWACRPNLISL
jgi:hypothetical protein